MGYLRNELHNDSHAVLWLLTDSKYNLFIDNPRLYLISYSDQHKQGGPLLGMPQGVGWGVRACVRACVLACVRACVCVSVCAMSHALLSRFH